MLTCGHLTFLCEIVSQQLTESDRKIMEEQGVSLPRGRRKKGKRRREGKTEEKERRDSSGSGAEVEWSEVRTFINPNPQLKGVALGKYAPKVFTSLVKALSLLICMACDCGVYILRVCLKRRWMSV